MESDLTIPRRFNLKHTTMNENIDLTKILKDCPKGFELYSPLFGNVKLNSISDCYIEIIDNIGSGAYFNKLGQYVSTYEVLKDCLLFPSKDQRDWNEFSAPWYKKEKFDPETLKPFDKVIVRNGEEWQCDFFSHMSGGEIFNKRCIGFGDKTIVIPYNNETKHLVGTKEEAPEYYRYWEE